MRGAVTVACGVVERGSGGVWGEAERTAYVIPETELFCHSRQRKNSASEPGRVGTLIPPEQYLVLRRGDRLLLGDDYKIGSPAKYDEHGKVVCWQPSGVRCRRSSRI